MNANFLSINCYLHSGSIVPGGASQVALVVKNPPTNAGDPGSIPRLGSFLGGGSGNPLQYSCLGNPLDRGAWQAAVRRATRVGQDWSDLACFVSRSIFDLPLFLVESLESFIFFFFFLHFPSTNNFSLKALTVLCTYPVVNFFSTMQISSVQPLSCVRLCYTMDCSMPGLPVHHHFPELTQTPVHRVGDAIQPSHPPSSPSPPAINLSQHQGLFKWVSSSHKVAKGLEFQLQHQSFQWIFRTDFF